MLGLLHLALQKHCCKWIKIVSITTPTETAVDDPVRLNAGHGNVESEIRRQAEDQAATYDARILLGPCLGMSCDLP